MKKSVSAMLPPKNAFAAGRHHIINFDAKMGCDAARMELECNSRFLASSPRVRAAADARNDKTETKTAFVSRNSHV